MTVLPPVPLKDLATEKPCLHHTLPQKLQSSTMPMSPRPDKGWRTPFLRVMPCVLPCSGCLPHIKLGGCVAMITRAFVMT